MLPYDPDLNLAAAAGALLSAAADLFARQYMLYPYKAVLMCRKWLHVTHQHAITLFLQATAQELDR
eukprot:4156825-Lingulodinium_polyedra.AAC.1